MYKKLQALFYTYEKCYVHNIFITNYKWQVAIGFNLNSQLKLINLCFR